MIDDLLPYYERELEELRRNAAAFAHRHPNVAGHLNVGQSAADDPHVERLIEASAFIASRIHRRLDDEFPEFTEAMLGVVYPQLVRPLPARGIVEVRTDFSTQAGAPPYRLPSGSSLRSRPVSIEQSTDEIECRFRTTTPLELWPIELTEARVRPLGNTALASNTSNGNTVISLKLSGLDGFNFPAEGLSKLRVHLTGDAQLLGPLYDLLVSDLAGAKDPSIWISHSGTVCAAPQLSLVPTGTSESESLLTADPRTAPGHRLLLEYCTFPEKFLFLEIEGLDRIRGELGPSLEIHFVRNMDQDSHIFDMLSSRVDKQVFRLGCVPIVNIFRRMAEPIRLDHRRYSYPIDVDSRRRDGYEIHSVRSVDLLRQGERIQRQRLPQQFGLEMNAEDAAPFAWHTHRKTAPDGAMEIEVRLVGRDWNPGTPVNNVLQIEVEATNRNLTTSLKPTNGTEITFLPETGQDVEIRLLRRLRQPVRPPLGTRATWELITLLSLNHVSLTDPTAGNLRRLLHAFNLSDREKEKLLFEDVARRIHSISAIYCKPVPGRVGMGLRAALVQGLRLDIDVDPEGFGRNSLCLFGMILSEFFALYANVNAFTQTRVFDGGDKPLKTFAPTAGVRSVI